MKRIYVSLRNIECEKPDGGGHGPEALYSITISVDGKKVLYLTSNNFVAGTKGDMTKFAEAMKEISANDISETIPKRK